MINLRNIALAAAILLALTVGVLADPASDTYEAGGEVFAEVSNLRLLEPNYRWTPARGELQNETLVEGHTVFVTMDMHGTREAVKGNLSVEGFVHCDYEANTSTSEYWVHTPRESVPVPIVTDVNYAWARCEAYNGLIVTPTIYCQISGNWGCTSDTQPPLFMTGRIIPFETPDAQPARLTEYFFTVPAVDSSGEEHDVTYYAWHVPVMQPWLSEDGVFRNLHVPIPTDRLYEMDTEDFKFLHADKVNIAQ